MRFRCEFFMPLFTCWKFFLVLLPLLLTYTSSLFTSFLKDMLLRNSFESVNEFLLLLVSFFSRMSSSFFLLTHRTLLILLLTFLFPALLLDLWVLADREDLSSAAPFALLLFPLDRAPSLLTLDGLFPSCLLCMVLDLLPLATLCLDFILPLSALLLVHLSILLAFLEASMLDMELWLFLQLLCLELAARLEGPFLALICLS
mmetsp:Transcript_19398/g.42148  ORF Transcript_19398/g.42148 Transcript_19398/m.42148 type:complete len:202 (+) Transcript_19398:585-1190(+)